MLFNSQPAVHIHLVKLVHVFTGVYVWEYITNLDFEWEIYTGRRRCRWSFVVYLLARVLALASLTTMLVGFNVTTPYNCNAWFSVVKATSWFSSVFASLLLVLRGVALWARDRKIIVLASVVWLANLGGSLYATMKGHSRMSVATGNCVQNDPSDSRWSIVVNFIQDLTLLCIMFSGVLRKRNSTRLWNMLYVQALWWALAWIITEVPSIVVSFRGMNEDWNLMFEVPHMTLTVITSSRAYRVLFQYISEDRKSGPPPRRLFRHYHNSTPPILYHGQDLQVTIQRTVEYDVELSLSPSCELPKHSLAVPQLNARGTATIVLDDARYPSSSSSTSEGSGSRAVCKALGGLDTSRRDKF